MRLSLLLGHMHPCLPLCVCLTCPYLPLHLTCPTCPPQSRCLFSIQPLVRPSRIPEGTMTQATLYPRATYQYPGTFRAPNDGSTAGGYPGEFRDGVSGPSGMPQQFVSARQYDYWDVIPAHWASGRSAECSSDPPSCSRHMMREGGVV
ncbi:hypothetical protein J3R83DRAFT_2379 [Lanmaoa asiatica]|nr:hypothetical protein J3R83DRAFT_2379 [Lanmaoa asiatica]